MPACLGRNTCPLVAVGPPCPAAAPLPLAPAIRQLDPRVASPELLLREAWRHMRQCPLVQSHLQGVAAPGAAGGPSPQLLGLWAELSNTQKRSAQWEETLAIEAEEWNGLSKKFVDLTRQSLLGVVKSLPLEFKQRNLVQLQNELRTRRKTCLDLRDDMVRRLQKLNKQQQINEESRRLLIRLGTAELNAKLADTAEARNLVDRHHYVARVTNQARQAAMNSQQTLHQTHFAQKNEQLKQLALHPELTSLGRSHLVQEDLTPEVNVTHVNKFDTRAAGERASENILSRERDRKPPTRLIPAANSLALDFFTGGFWLKNDEFRNPPHERNVDFEQRRWRMTVGERPIAQQEPTLPRKADKEAERTHWRAKVDFAHRETDPKTKRKQLAKCFADRRDLGEPYGGYDESDCLPIAAYEREQKARADQEKLERAKERARAAKKKRIEEEREAKARQPKPFSPRLPFEWLVPATSAPQPREYKRVVDDLNTIDTCGALTGADFLDYKPPRSPSLKDSYITF